MLGGCNVFIGVCFVVCLLVIRITRKDTDGSRMDLVRFAD